jgi:hypothetical protein
LSVAGFEDSAEIRHLVKTFIPPFKIVGDPYVPQGEYAKLV